MDPIDKKVYRIPVFGESQVGKSCILSQFLSGQFSDTYLTTIGIDKLSKKTIVKDKEKGDVEILLSLLDTAGQERFRSITTQTYKSADGIFVVFSVIERKTFDQVSYWMEQVRDSNGKVPIILLGNKIDLVNERVISKEEAEGLAKKLGVQYFETSAKTGQGINEAFTCLSQKAYDTYKEDDERTKRLLIEKNKLKEKEKSGCCKKEKK